MALLYFFHTAGLPIAGMSVKHRDAEGVMQTVKFVAMGDMSSQRQGLSWAQALRMVQFALVYFQCFVSLI